MTIAPKNIPETSEEPTLEAPMTNPLYDSDNTPNEPPPNMDLTAALALLRKLIQNSEKIRQIGPHDLVIVEVPTIEWVHAVASVLPAAFVDKPPAQLETFRGQPLPDDTKTYTVFEISDAAYRSDRRLKEITDSVAAQKLTFVVTHNISTFVPKPVEHAADHIFELPSFDAETLASFLTDALRQELQNRLPDIDYQTLRPPAFCLARRDGQTPDDYAKRLVEIAGRPDAKPQTEPEGLSLNEFHGMPDVVGWAESLAIDLGEFRAGRLSWADCDKGALLCGPPGTGKTSVARAIAAHCNIPFIATSYAEWQSVGEGHLGNVTSAIRNIFANAKKQSPCILFIDEIDSIGNRERSTSHDEWWRSIVNVVLEQLDGSVGREGVVVIGATNYPDSVDAAVKRPGRLDRRIDIPLPTPSALADIFGVYLKDALPPAD